MNATITPPPAEAGTPCRREWNTIPAEALPLRKPLPREELAASDRRFTSRTSDMLTEWGARQPAAGEWIEERTAEYFRAHPNLGLHSDGQAIACLDLLQWQSSQADPRRAVDDLAEQDRGFDDVIRTWRKKP